MGFSLEGISPKQNTDKPEILKNKFWDLDDSQHDDYFTAQDEYEHQNPGRYFRVNVWGWRPIWGFVCNVCDEILTEKDCEYGHYNGGHKISKTKAVKIAKKIKKLDKDNIIKGYETLTNEKVNAAREYNERWEVAIEQDSRLRDWTASYPFSRDLILKFANFCEQSGGFTIC
tara:strand:+ start:278 stop:793 length:516 start_codon:yes stop_codon:yes gene_type:complete